MKEDNLISVSLTPDKMSAYISVYGSETGNPYTVDDILKALDKSGVKYGIDQNTIKEIVEKKLYGQKIKVASGKWPVDGIDGKIDYHIKLKGNNRPRIREDGKVDFKNLDLIQSVKKGEKLCTLIPSVPGINGMNVLGVKLLPRGGKPVKLPVGKNVAVTEDGNSLISTIDGHISFTNEKINVYPTYEISGNVDNSTGNINFLGNVVVRGNVLAGFSVIAGGNIEVWGIVEGALLEADGDILIRRGVAGNNKAVIKSKGNIYARFIERSNIEARNDIRAETIMHSTVKCGGKLTLEGRNGLLVGGTSFIGEELSAKIIGSQMASATIIEVGVDYELREKQKQLKTELDEIITGAKKSEQIISILSKLDRSNALTQDKKELLEKTIKTKEFYDSKISELKDILEKIEGKLYKGNGSKIRCSGIIYPGVRITINSATMYVKEELQYCMLCCKGVDVKIAPIR